MLIIWGQVSHVASPIISLWGEYWNCSFSTLYIVPTPSSDTLNVVIHYCLVPYLIFAFLSKFLWRPSWRHRVILGSSAFFVNNSSDLIAIESRERHHCDGTGLPNRLICNLISLAQSMTLGGVKWPWPRGQPWLWPLPNKIITNNHTLSIKMDATHQSLGNVIMVHKLQP